MGRGKRAPTSARTSGGGRRTKERLLVTGGAVSREIDVVYESLPTRDDFGRSLRAYRVRVDGELVGQVFQQPVTVDGPRMGRHVVLNRRTTTEWGYSDDAEAGHPRSSITRRTKGEAVATLLGAWSATKP